MVETILTIAVRTCAAQFYFFADNGVFEEETGGTLALPDSSVLLSDLHLRNHR
ncbi:hypothetical protein O9929_13500 [Vibrio lentus]|nr:hypothetical protein [Vibrio lentus]